MIARAEKKTEDAYTEETWNLFAEALTAAKAAAEKEDITQEEADNARDALRSAMENLEKKDADVVNKEALKAAIEEAEKKEEVDIIGQFGVGFYSAFMVSDKVTVDTKAFGSSEAWHWESEGLSGYEITPGAKEGRGTTLSLIHI